MSARILKLCTVLIMVSIFATPVYAAPTIQSPSPEPSATPQPSENLDKDNVIDPKGIDALSAKAGGAAISIAPQTGAARFVRFTSQQAEQISASFGANQPPKAMANSFLTAYGSVFGIQNLTQELSLESTETDDLGTQLVYRQVYHGLPVFAGILKVHFNSQEQISAVNGMFIPGITVSATPKISVEQAKATVLSGSANDAAVQNTQLLIYRENLAQGIPGSNHLAYEIQISNHKDIHEYVYVDAHKGNIIDRIQSINDFQINVYDDTTDPATLVYSGNDTPAYSGGDAVVEELIKSAKETYNLYKNITNGAYRSYDGKDAVMNSYMNSTHISGCPNANWDGAQTNFCAGVTADDVIAHEWSHAYTEYTHELIYAWQPGALNEAYSDIFGEAVDLLNNRGTDTPDTPRLDETCTTSSALPALTVNSPAQYAGTYSDIGAADFGPALDLSGVTGDVVLGIDGTDETKDGCQALTNTSAINGNIALVMRGTCPFTDKVKNAQNAGAKAVIIYNNAPALQIDTMGGTDDTITIPSILISYELGTNLEGGANATVHKDDTGLVDTYRWLMGEDASAFGGPIRDMRSPTCFDNPGKVSDSNYWCGETDSGGVHSNSGIPNHAFAMLVDGDTANSISGIGLNKALAIYWRAESVYQHPSTDFADHADALETSCADLTGATLYSPTDGSALSETITSSDCAALTQVISAAELRAEPTQCNFVPLLDKNTPAKCNAEEGRVVDLKTYDFETASTQWQVQSQSSSADFHTPDWTRVTNLPEQRSGYAFYAVNSADYGNCTDDDQSGERYLESPLFTAPAEPPYYFSFNHYLSTEKEWDGGVVEIQVNGGSWETITEGAFTFNPYKTEVDSDAPYLADQYAFSGSDGGSTLGSWGTSRINLEDYVHANDTFRIRFNLFQDGCNGVEGWYVDDVQFYSCTTGPYQTFLPNVN